METNMNIHEDIEREAEQYVATIVNPELESALPLILYAYKKAATAERVKGMAFAEWCSVDDWVYYSDKKLWVNLSNQMEKTTSDLFQIFLQNEK